MTNECLEQPAAWTSAPPSRRWGRRRPPLLRRRRDPLHGAAVAVGEGRGVDLLELDLAVEDALLPLEKLRMRVLELRHHLASEELEGFADVLVPVLAGLVQQHDLVDVGALEAAQLAAQRLGRADEAAAQGRRMRLGI